MKKVTKKDVQKFLKDNNLSVHAFTLKNGEITLKRSYYFGGNEKLLNLENAIKKVENVQIIRTGNQFRPFKGGATAGSKDDSYVYVVINADIVQLKTKSDVSN